jgi:hypothetical protein
LLSSINEDKLASSTQVSDNVDLGAVIENEAKK